MKLITFNEYLRVMQNPKNNSVARAYYDKLDTLKYLIVSDEGRYYNVQAYFDNGKYSNEVSFDINRLDYSVENYECNCQWSTADSGCGHLGCVLLYLMNHDINTNQLPYIYGDPEFKKKQELIEDEESEIDAYFSERIISELENDFKLNGFRIEEDKIISLEPLLNYEYGMLKIAFKIGSDKKYKIKNLVDFVSNVENKEIYKYGKFLTVTHNYDNFDDNSKLLYEFIKKYAGEDLYSFSSASNKEIRINSDNIDDLYELSERINLNNVEFFDVESKLRVEVEKRKFGYRFKKIILEENRIVGKSAVYSIDYHVDNELYIYRNNFHGYTDVIKLIDLLNRDTGLYISNKHLRAFNRYLMNGIKNEIQISDYPLGDSADEQIKIYGDINENDVISFTVQSEINDQRTFGFSENNDNKSALLERVEDFIGRYAYKIDTEINTAYLDNNDEFSYIFINEGLPLLQQYCDVYISDNLKKLGVAQSYNISVGVRINNNLLDVDFSSVEIPNDELMNVLSSYRKKKKYHKLKNGDLLYLNSENLESLDNLMETYDIKVKDIEDNHAEVGLYRAFAFDEMADNEENLLINRESSFNELVHGFENFTYSDYPVMEPYDEILRDYQKDGYKWLRCLGEYNFGGILADDMGLGKTLQVISMIDAVKANGVSIVVCPSSLILNWVDEVNKFTDNIKVMGIYGNQTYRQYLIDIIGEYDLVVTSYDYLRRDIEFLKDYQFNYIILDEAQYIKNKNTKNARSVKMLKGINRLALTGTPIENTLAELWSIFDFLMPGYLYNYHYFKRNFETPIVKEHDEQKQIQLKQLIQPFILRRNKKEVLEELPDKIEHNLEFVFTDEEKKIYYANLSQVNQSLREQMKLEKMDKIAVLAMLMRLRQICIEPRLVYEDITNSSSKMIGCLDLLSQLVENKQKVLLFSSFTSVLDLLAEELDKRHYSYFKLTGSTNKSERHRLVNEFQNDDTMIFLISLKAGGTGLNLTSAEAVIHFDPWWNVSAQNQATDRAYRIGQKNNVQVFKLIMKDSIEEKILRMQEVKKDLADIFVEDNSGVISKMNAEELIELFK